MNPPAVSYEVKFYHKIISGRVDWQREILYNGTHGMQTGGTMSKPNPRLAHLQTLMASAGIDLIAVGPTANMRYLLGTTPYPDERLCLLLVSRQDVQLVVPALNAAKTAEGTDVSLVAWADETGPDEALGKALTGAVPVKRLAIDGGMRADFVLPLLAQTHPEETITAGPLLAQMRQRKSPEELAALRRAAAQADRAMQAAVDACRVGVTEAEVAWATETAFRKDGAERVEFTLVASGPHGAFPHHEAGPRPLSRGDAVVLDIGATLDGYQSDITRMVYLGQPDAEFRAAYAAVLKANQAGREAVRPGVTAGEVDAATRGVLERAGYGALFVHRTGHGLGLEGHEPPWIMARSAAVLEEGMVFSVEPGVYIPGRFGIRIEDIVVVTATGVETLTRFDHDLVVKS
jgi:Xaa-Pro aminopeptidase